MEDKNISNPNGADEMVQTLDGRIVNKKSIKNGEIYINSQGKKVRKVVKKVVRPSTGGEGQVSSHVSNNEKAENTITNSENSNDNKNQNAQQERKETANINTVNTGMSNENATDSKTQQINPDADLDFRARISSRHSFLSKIENNQKISTPGYGNAQLAGAEKSANGGGSNGEENLGADKSVTDLEQAVVDEMYNDSIGKNGTGASSGARKSNVSGKASNPQGSVLNNPVSNADNAISRGLTGSYSVYGLATPKTQSVALAKPKKKAKKPIKLWVPASIIAGIYVVVCLIYFISNYNFQEKSVQVGEYYLSVGNASKMEYYDGERFNFYQLAMTYNYGGGNIDEVEMSKYNLSLDANSQKTMGYTLNDGYISARWEGDYENATQRTVSVKFTYNNEVGYIPVTIYRNDLESLSGQGSINVINNGGTINEIGVLIWGNYTNDLVKKNGITLEPRKLNPTEYVLDIYTTNLVRPLATLTYDNNYDVDNSSENADVFTLKRFYTSGGSATILFSDIQKIVVRSTSKNLLGVEPSATIYQKYTVLAVTENDLNEEVSAGADDFNANGFKLVERGTGADIDSSEVVLNNSISFKLVLKEGYYENDVKVSYCVNDGSYTELTDTYLDGDGERCYLLSRDKITGNLKIKVTGISNQYPIYFYTLDSSGIYNLDSSKTQTITYGTSYSANIADANNYSGHNFTGWLEADGEYFKPSDVNYLEGATLKNYSSAPFVSNGIQSAPRYFYAQYDLQKHLVEFTGNGYTLKGVVGSNVVTISSGETYEFTDGDVFRFNVIADSGYATAGQLSYYSNGIWTDYTKAGGTYGYQLTFNSSTKITQIYVASTYSISSDDFRIDSIMNEGGATLSNIETNRQTDSYIIKVKLKQYCELTSGECPDFGSEFVFNSELSNVGDAIYAYTITKENMKNFVLKPTNVVAKLTLQINSGSNATLSNSTLELSSLTSDKEVQIIPNDGYKFEDTINVLVGEESSSNPKKQIAITTDAEGLQVNPTITITSDELKNAFEGSGTIQITVEGVVKILQEEPSE